MGVPPPPGSSVAVYDTDGWHVRSFGGGSWKNACDMTATNDGRVMLVNWGWIGDDDCVHIFSEDGDYLGSFKRKLQGRAKIVFHQLTESVVIAVMKEELVVGVEIFTKDGEFVRSAQIHEERFRNITRITVTKDGRIAVLLRDIDDKFKVLVI